MLKMTTLGNFRLENECGVLNNEKMKSSMLIKLLVYQVLHRKQSMLTLDEISAALWQDDEIENPAGALKNLMYRLRTQLKQEFGDNQFLITQKHSYCWNSEVEIKTDVEEFERLYNIAKKSENSFEDAIRYYEEAVALYQGDFMPCIAEMYWVITLNMYYHSMYLSCVKGLAELYDAEERFDDLESLCKNALNIDKTEEELYYYLIIARMKNNKVQLALESYENACKILKQELGIEKPKRLQEIYEELLKMDKGTETIHMHNLQSEIAEAKVEGVFFCGHPVFREIYRLEARKKIRFQSEECLMLISVAIKNAEQREYSKIEEYRIKQSMNRIEQILNTELRLGDVASRYNSSQFIVLLSACSCANSDGVASRIIERFDDMYPKYQDVYITIKPEELEEASTMMEEEFGEDA